MCRFILKERKWDGSVCLHLSWISQVNQSSLQVNYVRGLSVLIDVYPHDRTGRQRMRNWRP